MSDGWRQRIKAAAIGLAAVALTGTDPAVDVRPQHWTRQSATELLGYVEKMDRHGLGSAEYERDALLWAIEYGDAAQLEHQASETFALVARDLANGHVRPAQRVRFHIATPPLQPAQIALLIDEALGSKDMATVLERLAPTNPQYAALRTALAKLPPDATVERRKIAVAMERWRWAPHDVGARYLLVNIPEYRVRLFDSGRDVAAHRVIVGQVAKPTPQFAAAITAVVINPTWEVPQSIIAESVGKLVRTQPQVARARGYRWNSKGAGLHVTQGPGAQNALGRMKLEMPNPYAVYLHDTPNKELFDKSDRTFSHGCIRTDKALDFAAELLAPAGWTRDRLEQAVGSGRTQRVALDRPVTVYVMYLPAFVGADGTVGYFKDPYALDDGVYDLLVNH